MATDEAILGKNKWYPILSKWNYKCIRANLFLGFHDWREFHCNRTSHTLHGNWPQSNTRTTLLHLI